MRGERPPRNPFKLLAIFARGSALGNSRGFRYIRLQVVRFSITDAEAGPRVRPVLARFYGDSFRCAIEQGEVNLERRRCPNYDSGV